MTIEELYKIPETYIEDSRYLNRDYTGWTVQEASNGTDGGGFKIYIHYVNGMYHSINNEPSYIETLAGCVDKIFCLEWHSNHKNHRINGPAIVYHDNDYNEYYLDGVNYSSEDYLSHPEVIKHILNSILKV